jgi:hypothetical protein
MSNVSNGTNEAEATTKTSESEKEAFVARSAYEEVSKDMHKYKTTNKELAAKLNELEARVKAQNEAKMQEEKRFEELYQKEREERMRAENALKNTNEHYIKTVKMTALMRELGNIKPKYLQHAALDEIIVHEDGSLSSESVVAVANKFRQENPELVPHANVGNLNDVAPSSETFKKQEVPNYEKMSKDELREVLLKTPRAERKLGIR